MKKHYTFVVVTREPLTEEELKVLEWQIEHLVLYELELDEKPERVYLDDKYDD